MRTTNKKRKYPMLREKWGIEAGGERSMKTGEDIVNGDSTGCPRKKFPLGSSSRHHSF